MDSFKIEISSHEIYSVLMTAARMLDERKKEFSELITTESGLCIKDTRHEVERAKQVLIMSAEEAKHLDGQTFQGDISPNNKKKFCYTTYEPVGIILCITPFNHPLNQVVHKVGPALAAKNKVLLKPSSKTPLTAVRFAELMYDAGLPKKMLQVIHASNDTMEKVLTNELIGMVSFTGSTEVGKKITKFSGIKKLSLELGGNGALIIDDTCDLEEAAIIATKQAFSNSGQRCTSIKRIILFDSIAEKFIPSFINKTKELVFGDPNNESTDVGTVINEESAIEIEKRIISAEHQGAKILLGGKREGAIIQPTILDHVKPTMDIVLKETFGPTAPIIRTKNFDEAIRITNDTIYGLQSGIMTNDLSRALRATKELRTGGVVINEAPGYRVESFPFGGIKQSGIGREGVRMAIKEMSNIKTVIM